MPKTLAALRRERGLTQRQLARALGLSYGAVGNYESGLASPSLRTARQIAAFFGVPLDELRFAGERDNTAPARSAHAATRDRDVREAAAA